MAKVTAPILSFDARGQIGQAQVYSSWKGIKYARRYVVPSNPKTTAQMVTRDLFRWLHDVYKFLSADVTAAWDLYAEGKPLTGLNAFIQSNLPVLRGDANNNQIVFAKPTRGGPPPAAVTVTGGAGQITVAADAPAVPTGWTVTQAILAIMEQVTAFTPLDTRTTQSFVDAAAPYSHAFTGLPSGRTYIGLAFFQFTRPDGSFAYGASMSGTAVTT